VSSSAPLTCTSMDCPTFPSQKDRKTKSPASTIPEYAHSSMTSCLRIFDITQSPLYISLPRRYYSVLASPSL
jgi:hypothetical protein